MRIPILVFLCLLCVGLPTTSVAEEIADKDLIGEWEIVEMIFRGKVQDFKGPNGGKFGFEGRTISRFSKSQQVEGDFDIEVRPEKKPREIDIKFSVPAFGIYEIDGDNMKLIYPELDIKRPTDFDALKNKNHTYYLLKRIK